MKILKIALILVTCGAILFSLSCASKSSSSQATGQQVATVKQGNINIDVTATGNLSLSQKKDLAFEIAGTVEEIMVEEGQSVNEGQELVKLDTEAWDDQITLLERHLTTAERQLTAAERKVTAAERKVTAAERKVTTAERQVTAAKNQVVAKEHALLQAKQSLKDAETALEDVKNPYTEDDIANARTAVLKAENNLSQAAYRKEIAISLEQMWSARDSYYNAEQALRTAKANLEEILAGADPEEVAQQEFAVEQAKWKIEDAKAAIEDAKVAVEDAQVAVEDAKADLKDAQADLEDAKTAIGDAQQAVEDAQKALDKTKSASPVVKAPFTGFITKINVSGGDEALKGTIALQIADPTKFEAQVLVSERDISSVKIGGDATVQLDAMSLNLPAKVTYIAPTATIQQGVVNYKVTVEVQSLQPVSRSQSGQRSRTSQSMSGGQAAIAPIQAIQLKEGLSVTVSIPILQKNNVLLVPNRAIARQGKDTVVQVLKTGVTETRVIKTGVSDLQNTEVTDGLNEGEQVVLPQATTTTTPQSGGMFRMVPGGPMR